MITVKQFLDAGFRLSIGDVVTNNHYKTDITLKDSSKSAPVWAERYAVDGVDLSVKSLAWRKNEGKQPVADGLSVIFHDEGASDYYALSEDVHWQGNKHCFWKPNLAALEQQMNDKQDMMTQAESDDIEHLEKSALEMSERDVPSFDEPIIVNPFDACASNEDGDYVEWNGNSLPTVGVKCEVLLPDSDWFEVEIVSVIKDSVGDDVVFYKNYNSPTADKDYDWCYAVSVKFREIESPQEKAERELDEAAEDLYREFNHKFFGGAKELYSSWDDVRNETKESFRYIASLTGYQPQQN